MGVYSCWGQLITRIEVLIVFQVAFSPFEVTKKNRDVNKVRHTVMMTIICHSFTVSTVSCHKFVVLVCLSNLVGHFFILWM